MIISHQTRCSGPGTLIFTPNNLTYLFLHTLQLSCYLLCIYMYIVLLPLLLWQMKLIYGHLLPICDKMHVTSIFFLFLNKKRRSFQMYLPTKNVKAGRMESWCQCYDRLFIWSWREKTKFCVDSIYELAIRAIFDLNSTRWRGVD